MRVTVRKWGNSASVRIPACVMQAARLELDAPVEIREENGRVVIVPIRDRKIDLEQLLDGITDDNVRKRLASPLSGDDATAAARSPS